MPAKSSLDVNRIVVSPRRVEHEAYWEFERRIMSGTVYHYTALDANEKLPSPWVFLVHVPKELRKGGYVLVQALDYPRAKAWTPIARTAINFAKATKADYRGMMYAKIRLSDPMSSQKYWNLAWAQREALPAYLREFELRPKKRVATTRGTDGDSLVAVVRREDHARMIQLFFGTKVWPLREGLPLATRKALGQGSSR